MSDNKETASEHFNRVMTRNTRILKADQAIVELVYQLQSEIGLTTPEAVEALGRSKSHLDGVLVRLIESYEKELCQRSVKDTP